jgi:hypothetical protein
MAHRLGSKEQGSLFADDIIFYEENNEACTSLMILARLWDNVSVYKSVFGHTDIRP